MDEVPLSEYEEDFDDFPTFSAENINRQTESMVGAYRAESTEQWTAASGITTKMPPLFGGPTSWFKYEELIDDWLDLTVLEAGKQGPALKNRLVRNAQGTSQSRILESRRWSQVFQGYVETPLHQGSSEYVPLEVN